MATTIKGFIKHCEVAELVEKLMYCYARQQGKESIRTEGNFWNDGFYLGTLDSLKMDKELAAIKKQGLTIPQEWGYTARLYIRGTLAIRTRICDLTKIRSLASGMTIEPPYNEFGIGSYNDGTNLYDGWIEYRDNNIAEAQRRLNKRIKVAADQMVAELGG